MPSKADYVAKQPGDGRHKCHWPGCEAVVKPAYWGCATHWYKLPPKLRTKVWRAYQPGQEVTKKPSKEYVRIAREVQDWIARNATSSGLSKDEAQNRRLLKACKVCGCKTKACYGRGFDGRTGNVGEWFCAEHVPDDYPIGKTGAVPDRAPTTPTKGTQERLF